MGLPRPAEWRPGTPRHCQSPLCTPRQPATRLALATVQPDPGSEDAEAGDCHCGTLAGAIMMAGRECSHSSALR